MQHLQITDTSAICPRCKQKLQASDLPNYPFVCKNCDENFYAIETKHDSREYFHVFIPLEKRAKDMYYLIEPIARKYNATCTKWSDKSQGIYVKFPSRFYAVDITEFQKEIQQLPYLTRGMELYEKIDAKNELKILDEKLYGISLKGFSYQGQKYDLYLQSGFIKSYKNIEDIGVSVFEKPKLNSHRKDDFHE